VLLLWPPLLLLLYRQLNVAATAGPDQACGDGHQALLLLWRLLLLLWLLLLLLWLLLLLLWRLLLLWLQQLVLDGHQHSLYLACCSLQLLHRRPELLPRCDDSILIPRSHMLRPLLSRH
jgi:hypothetical protein